MNKAFPAAVLSILLTFVAAASAWAEGPAAKPIRVLAVDKDTPKLEVRYSQIGFRDTLLFYTFAKQRAVLKLRFGNQDKTFPASATFYLFDDDVTEEGMKKWLNNQHSDGLYPDVPEPTSTHQAPAKVCQVTSHKFIDHSKQTFGEYDTYDVAFQVNDYADMMTVKLKGFAGETKVHVKTK